MMNKQMRHFRFLAKPLLRGESMCSKCYQEADRTFSPSDILWLTSSSIQLWVHTYWGLNTKCSICFYTQ